MNFILDLLTMAAPLLHMYMTFQILLLFPVPLTNITIVASQIKVQNQLKPHFPVQVSKSAFIHFCSVIKSSFRDMNQSTFHITNNLSPDVQTQ